MGRMGQSLGRREFLRAVSLTGAALITPAGCSLPSFPAAAGSPAGAERPGAAPRSSAPAERERPATVRMGVLRVLEEAGLYFALERGYFAEEGLAVEPIDYRSGTEVIPSLATGQLHVATVGLNAALFNALAHGVWLQLVALGSTHHPGSSGIYMMVRPDLVRGGAVSGYADLRGRRIGVAARGAFLYYLGILALRQGGVSADDVDWLELTQLDMVTALARGALDVALQIEPVATLTEDRGLAVKWRSAGDVRPGICAGGLFFAPDFAASQADVGRRWMVAYLRGVRDYNAALHGSEGRDQIAAVLSRHTPVTDAALYHRMSLTPLEPDGRIDAAAFADQLGWYVAQGIVPPGLSFRAALAPGFAEYAARRLGNRG